MEWLIILLIIIIISFSEPWLWWRFIMKSKEKRIDYSNVIVKEDYIKWLQALRDSTDDEQVQDMYDALISDTKKLW